MATVTISDELAALAEARAAAEGYADVGSYVESLLLAPTEYAGPGAGHLTVRGHDQVVALAREGMASPARDMTRADFDRLRSELVARHGKQPGG